MCSTRSPQGRVFGSELWKAIDLLASACLPRHLSPAPPPCAVRWSLRKSWAAGRLCSYKECSRWTVTFSRLLKGMWERRGVKGLPFEGRAVCTAFYVFWCIFTTCEVEVTIPISQMMKLRFRMMQGQRILEFEPTSACPQSHALSSDPSALSAFISGSVQ